MLSNRPFLTAVFISLVAHTVILLQNTNFLPKDNKKDNKPEKFEISYLDNSKQPRQLDQDKKTPDVKKEPFLKLSSMITASKIAPPFIDKPEVFKKNQEFIQQKPSFIRPALIKPDIIAVKKKITLPPVDIDKSNNPSYISYYQIVREKIKRAAYRNYTRIEVGEVYLSFIISGDGYIREVRIVDEKSSPSPYLKQIALNSLKDASPFPNFPKDLDYPQLSFNVVISFEAE